MHGSRSWKRKSRGSSPLEKDSTAGACPVFDLRDIVGIGGVVRQGLDRLATIAEQQEIHMNSLSRRAFLAVIPFFFSPVALANGAEAVAVIRRYYAAINVKKYKIAFNLWSGADSGTIPTGQTYAQFKAGFKNTRSVSVKTGTPGEIEGAAGSSFIEIPVKVKTVSKTGAVKHFAGRYTLRKSNVEGGDPNWKLFSASLS
jgi:hypothetical protein